MVSNPSTLGSIAGGPLSPRRSGLCLQRRQPIMEISVGAKVELPIGKKLFYLVVFKTPVRRGARPWTWNWYKLRETCKWHTNSNRENGPTCFDFPLFLGIVQWEEPAKRVPFTSEPEIPEILTKWKAPLITSLFRKGPGPGKGKAPANLRSDPI